jgi:hypothetical protein
LCATNKTFLSTPGHFKPQRSQWELHVGATTRTTAVVTVRARPRRPLLCVCINPYCGFKHPPIRSSPLQAGRDCPDGEHGLAGPSAAANTKVFLAGKSHMWTVAHVRGDCTLVNIIDSVSMCRRFWVVCATRTARSPSTQPLRLPLADPRRSWRARVPQLSLQLRRHRAAAGVEGLRHRPPAVEGGHVGVTCGLFEPTQVIR